MSSSNYTFLVGSLLCVIKKLTEKKKNYESYYCWKCIANNGIEDEKKKTGLIYCKLNKTKAIDVLVMHQISFLHFLLDWRL